MNQLIDLPEHFYNAIKLAPSIIDWSIVLETYNLNDSQLNEFFAEIGSYETSGYDGLLYLFKFQKLSIDFIKQNIHNISTCNWNDLSLNENLSEEIIDEYIDEVNWKSISLHKKMDINFVKKYSNKVDYKVVLKNWNVSQDIKAYCRMFL